MSLTHGSLFPIRAASCRWVAMLLSSSSSVWRASAISMALMSSRGTLEMMLFRRRPGRLLGHAGQGQLSIHRGAPAAGAGQRPHPQG
jgi:hypothetical protein